MLDHLGGCPVSLLIAPDTLPVRIWTGLHGGPQVRAVHRLAGQGGVLIPFLKALGQSPVGVGMGWAPI